MPNWVMNTIKVKGNNENILNFLNEGVKNSDGEIKATIREAFDFLRENALTAGMGSSVKNPKIEKDKSLSMGTFRQMDDSYLLYDTTNRLPQRDSTGWDGKSMFDTDEEYEAFCKAYDEAVKYQKETYGSIGWYDANCNVYYGCKWNSDIRYFNVSIGNETSIVTFELDTPWDMPDLWMRWIKETFNVNVFYCSFEESNAFNCYGEIDDGEDCNMMIEYPDREDFLDDDDYYNACDEAYESAKESVLDDFNEFVENYEIDF